MVSNQISAISTFRAFKEEYNSKMSTKDYQKLYSSYCDFLAKKILEGYEVSLPSNLGTIQVMGKKINFGAYSRRKHDREINWEATNKLRAEGKSGFIYFLNEDTDYTRFKITWNSRTRAIINKTFYKFTSTRGIKRSLAKSIKEGKEYLIK